MDRKKHVAEIGTIRKDMAKTYQRAIVETFNKELGSIENLESLVGLAAKVKDLAADTTWREATWKDSSGSWRESWSEDSSMVARPEMFENPAVIMDRLKGTIEQLVKAERLKG